MTTQSISPLDVCLRLARAQAVQMRRLDTTLGNLHGISFGDYQLLHYLGRAPSQRLRRVDLADALALTASGVTRNLLALEKIGLVERQSDPRDARVGYAALTEAGKVVLEDASVSANQAANDLLGSASSEHLNTLHLTLGLIAGK